MDRLTNRVQNTQNKFSRISWAGVLAGTLTTLTVLILLSLLGLGIGLTTIDPMTEQDPFSGLGTGAIVWWIVSNLVALFIGGMVAARTSGLPSNVDGGIHGFLVWGASLVAGLLLMNSVIGSVLGGVGAMVSGIFSDSTAENIAAQMDAFKNESEQSTDLSIASVKSELFQLINKGENLDLLPEGTAGEAREGVNDVHSESNQALNKLDIDNLIENFVNDIKINLDRNGDLDVRVAGNKDYVDKAAIREYLTANTALSDAEINGVITKWEKKIDEAVKTVKAQYAEVKAEVQEISEEATDAAGKYGIMAFGILLLGALSGVFGGATASPEYTVTEEHRRDLADDRA